MKNKGFTLVEMILVVVIIGIIGVITVPNIMESLESSRKDSGDSVEKLLKYNLKLYNIDNEEDLWASGGNCKVVDTNTFLNKYQDIDMGECFFQNSNSLVVKKTTSGYEYYANIICGKDLKDTNGNKILNGSGEGAYYKTNFSGC